jgi:NAD(P)-dependent dehydrogenase (short-subunit alcohol dehydrogenase family)
MEREQRGIPVVLVTGASRGLGRGIAVCLARRGCSVAVNYTRNETAAAETLDLCEKQKSKGEQRFRSFRADIASSPGRGALLESVLDRYGRIDALINNAGIAPRQRADLTEMKPESFKEVLSTNLEGPFFMTQLVANHWLDNGNGSFLGGGFAVVFITSVSSHTASVNRGEYCISKAGLSMARQLWAARLAEHGIGVYEVRPGIMATDMTKGVKEKYDRLIAEGLVPQKRWGTPEDVGMAVASLIDGSFAFSTGTVVDVDGGFQLRRL